MNKFKRLIQHPTETQIHNSVISLVWLMLLVMTFAFAKFPEHDWKPIIKILTEYLILFVLFALNRIYVHFFLLQKKTKQYAIYTVLSLFFISSIMIICTPVHQNGLPPIGVGFPSVEPPPFDHFMPPFINIIVKSILLMTLDTVLYISMGWLKKQREHDLMEKEYTQMKLSFLQQQISPHLFMNTLNNIHALIDIDTEKAQQAVIQLSDLMSYLTYESGKKKVPLKEEVLFIDNYLALMRLRFPKRVIVTWDRPNDQILNNWQISPILFISYIENAFKHGIDYHKASFIHIKLSLIEQQTNRSPLLVLSVVNTNHAKTSKQKHGLGMINMKKRLDMLYTTHYQLEIKQDEYEFKLLLTIPLWK